MTTGVEVISTVTTRERTTLRVGEARGERLLEHPPHCLGRVVLIARQLESHRLEARRQLLEDVCHLRCVARVELELGVELQPAEDSVYEHHARLAGDVDREEAERRVELAEDARHRVGLDGMGGVAEPPLEERVAEQRLRAGGDIDAERE